MEDADKRILLVQPGADFSGSTISGYLIAKGLREAGWEVDVAFGCPGPFAERYETVGCRIHYIEHGSWLGGGSMLRRIRRLGKEIRSLVGFVRLLRRLKPRVVYANTILGISAITAARMLGIPSAWHLRELFDDVGGEMHAPVIGGRALVRRAVKHLPNRVVVVSEAVARSVLGVTEHSKLRVVRNAVTPAFFQECASANVCRQCLDLPTDVPIIGLPGTLRPMKGHPLFLRAAAEILRVVPRCHFAATGEGTLGYRNELQELIEQLGLQGHVHFVGTVEDMREFYRACDVVCVPSRGDPLPRVVIEAFVMGVPVVATAVGGIPEMVEHGTTGLLVPYGDVEGLARQLVRLLEDADLRTRLAERARQEAQACYHEDVYHQRIRDVVAELLNET
ncbi:MAG: glycosyltransferase family 4 protein [Planctomycetes bacterium]|nr:glycosyltransferase family 4 protein [Planctomycetota bacterium]